jgi:hypothetical protein
VPRRFLKRRLLATGGVVLAVLIGAATLYAAGFARPGSTPPRIQTSSSGAMSVSNSNPGAAIFDLANFSPGTSGQGEVTIGNNGTDPGTLTLTPLEPADAPGVYGGALSSRIDLRIAELSAGGEEQIYSGGLDTMPGLRLGTLAAGESRTYRFSATMRDGGAPASPYADDNLYQQATTSLGYEWTLTEAEVGAESPEIPSPPQVPTTELPGGPPPGVPPDSHRLVGDARSNSLAGTSGVDLIYGRGGADVIHGRGADDYLLGGAGADRVYGGPGNDRLRGGTGADSIAGGSGADVLFARDGVPDLVSCGSGADTAYVDVHDRVTGCEAIHLRYGRLFAAQPSGG